MKKECIICLKAFEYPDTARGRKKKTCSIPCARQLGYLNSITVKQCERCGNDMETTKSNLHPRCKTCLKNKRKYEYECVECHKMFTTNHHNSTLCSGACITKHKNKDNISLKCLYCRKTFQRPRFTVIKESSERVYCSSTCRNNQFSIENPTRYGGTWTRRSKEIKNRDNNHCLNCGSVEKLQVHHFKKMKSFKNPNDAHYDENVGTFCATCHKKVEGKYLSLSEFLKDIV